MKKLVLIRHAEAKPIDGNITDFERSLTSLGKHQAARMAATLLNNGSKPEIIITSPAFRALTTAQIFVTALGLDDVKTNAAIYESIAETLLQIINQLDNRYQVVAMVGHNPGISNILYHLTGKITTMPTASWAELNLGADSWAEICSGSGELIHYQYP